MTEQSGNNAMMDDLESYIATFSEEELDELAAAETAIDIAILLHRAREHRGLSQAAAAERAGLQQQAVSRLERRGANPRLETIRSYLEALGFGLELSVFDLEAGPTIAAVGPFSARGERRDVRNEVRALILGAADAVNRGYAFMEASEVANRKQTIERHADAVALWGRALTLYREGMLGESSFSEAAVDPDQMRAFHAQSQLLSLGVNSAKAAIDLLLDGYYSPAYATVRHMIETFAHCSWLIFRPGEAVRWFDSSDESEVVREPPRMKEIVEQIKSDVVRQGASREQVTDRLDRVYRSWKLMSKGAHPSGEGLVQTLGTQDGHFLIGGTYQRDMCLIGFDHGLFAVAHLLPQALVWIKPQSAEWQEAWERLQGDVASWRSPLAMEVSAAEEKLDEAA